jgi:Mg2+ and Co2+ transporter CorA
MNNDLFKGIELPKVKFDLPDVSGQIQRMNRVMEEQQARVAEQHARKEEYNQDVLNTLKNIEKNTGDISQLVSMLHDNSEKQLEILDTMKEILSIGTANTEVEAESKYRKVMNKITTTFEDAETMEKLLGYSKVVYHSAKEYIKFKIENGG